MQEKHTKESRNVRYLQNNVRAKDKEHDHTACKTERKTVMARPLIKICERVQDHPSAPKSEQLLSRVTTELCIARPRPQTSNQSSYCPKT
uniref:Uncharacterized protein n=1 Tax=Noccaea caerulescens TaxID=107243 RepID=A0A1J3HXP1_NOCCA